jgi:hypothetical protein
MFNRFRLIEQGKNRFSLFKILLCTRLIESAVDNRDRSAYRVITPFSQYG